MRPSPLGEHAESRPAERGALDSRCRPPGALPRARAISHVDHDAHSKHELREALHVSDLVAMRTGGPTGADQLGMPVGRKSRVVRPPLCSLLGERLPPRLGRRRRLGRSHESPAALRLVHIRKAAAARRAMNWTREPLGQLELPFRRARRGAAREQIEVRIRQRVVGLHRLRTLVVEDLVEDVLDLDEVALIFHD